MLTSFFWMCSGADTDVLEQSPKSEQIKYAGVGGTVFFTALLAFVASAYALYTVFDNVWLSVAFGLIWGLLIFNLDRFIVSTIKKQDDRMKELGQAFPRLILAVIIAVVIAKPLELKIFEKEIDRVLVEQKNDMLLANQGQVAALFDVDKTRIEEEITTLNQQVEKKTIEVNALYDIFIAEAEGTAGTKLLGKGPVYAEKREKHDQALADLAALKAVNNEQVAKLQSDLATLQTKEETRLAETAPVINGFDGLMARINALSTLPFLPSFFIFLLFLAIETSPILAKLLSARGEYDMRLADREQRVHVWTEQRIRQRASMLAADIKMNTRVYESLAKEDEVYHDKKQKARAAFYLQQDAFLKEQERLAKG